MGKNEFTVLSKAAGRNDKRQGTSPRLHYVTDQSIGIRRRRIRGHFAYFTPDGERIKDTAEIARINALVIPPAYEQVWICADPFGHLQATGRDARGRKQYRYHPQWRVIRDASKYDRMLSFGQALPQIRQRIEHDLSLPGLPRERVLALIVRLLETTLIRVGNDEYARSNDSYGLTTLENRHVDVSGSKICFRFRGKSGVEHDISVRDPRMAKIIRRCIELPGYELFQYLDDAGQSHKIGSSDVNAYLQELSGGDFTAKDYRTWAGSVLAFAMLRNEVADTESERKKTVVSTIAAVAERLGNTVAVCRKCYIHPAVLQGFLEDRWPTPRAREASRGLSSEEKNFLYFLEEIGQQSFTIELRATA